MKYDFTEEETSALLNLMNDYSLAYKDAVSLNDMMNKIEENMKSVMDSLESIKSKEEAIYETYSQRTGYTIDQAREVATKILLENAKK